MFKVNSQGKIKTSLRLDPQLLGEAKDLAANRHLTIGNVIEETLTEYLTETDS
jgi:hypothetical protein